MLEALCVDKSHSDCKKVADRDNLERVETLFARLVMFSASNPRACSIFTSVALHSEHIVATQCHVGLGSLYH